MGRLSLIIECLTLAVDIGILWILWVEFNYDKIQDEKREYKETQKKKKSQKSKVEQQTLREGTSGIPTEAKREVRDMPEGPESIQTSSEPGPQP